MRGCGSSLVGGASSEWRLLSRGNVKLRGFPPWVAIGISLCIATGNGTLRCAGRVYTAPAIMDPPPGLGSAKTASSVGQRKNSSFCQQLAGKFQNRLRPVQLNLNFLITCESDKNTTASFLFVLHTNFMISITFQFNFICFAAFVRYLKVRFGGNEGRPRLAASRSGPARSVSEMRTNGLVNLSHCCLPQDLNGTEIQEVNRSGLC